MMPDSLKIWGTEYTGVAGFIAKDSSNNEYTYTRPSGTVNITENGVVDVVAYASASIDVDRTGGHVTQEGGSIVIPADEVDSGWSIDDIAQAKAPSGSVVLSVPYVEGYGKDGIRDYAFYGNSVITDITITTYPNIYTYAFANMKALQSISAPLCQSFGNRGINYADSVLRGCTALVTVNLPELVGISGNMFNGCTSLVNIVLPKATSMAVNGSFNGCTSLASVDFGTPTKIGGSDFFKNCSSLTTLILRGSSICALNNTGCLSGTPFESGGAGGTIYILKSLYDCLGDGTSSDYKAATNWSTVDGYGTITWACIEGSYYETHYADGTEIPSA